MQLFRKRGTWLVLTLLVSAALVSAAWWTLTRESSIAERVAPADDNPPPNVLLISLDTLRPDHLGCYGYTKLTSPHLDRLARAGIVLTNCRCQAPWTLPSHMSLFTSTLPTYNGVDGLNKSLPAEFHTLAQHLRENGYRTAGLVNSAQMRAHWGFARGFETWREFEADVPEGNCENITAQARAWLRSNAAADRPFFLFLHYYDPHDPYEAPEPFRNRLGTTLSGKKARELCFRYRFPDLNIRQPGLLADLIAAYDAEIAWLDHELGKLLEEVPANTLIVIFSDHGEAFEEHGWTLHGATLYEEEVRVPLLIRLPESDKAGTSLPDSVMLMDVAPTILNACGLRAPAQFQGEDLSPLWHGKKLPARLIPSETKAVLEGRYLLSAVQHPLKGIYSLFDGGFELYKLPDEHKNLKDSDPAAAKALLKPLREWIEGEQFWMIHAVGRGDFEAVIEADAGFGLFIPIGHDRQRDDIEALADGRALRWHVYPDGGVKSLFLQPAKADAGIRLDVKINGTASEKKLFLGKDGKHPVKLPATVSADLPPVSPFIEQRFASRQEGFHVMRHRSAGSRAAHANVLRLDEQTLRQLRSLGYVQ